MWEGTVEEKKKKLKHGDWRFSKESSLLKAGLDRAAQTEMVGLVYGKKKMEVGGDKVLPNCGYLKGGH